MRIKVRSSEFVGPIDIRGLWVPEVTRPKVAKKHKTLPVRYHGKKGGYTMSML